MPAPPLSKKILNLPALLRALKPRRSRGERVVFTNGCFDLVHPGHVKCLEGARDCGDLLIVGINSDASVRRLKGAGRPIFSQEERALVLAGLRSVDYVCVFAEDTPLALIEAILPDVLVKGGDWRRAQIVGKDVVEAAGGRVLSLPFVEGHSTTAILERIAKEHKLAGEVSEE